MEAVDSDLVVVEEAQRASVAVCLATVVAARVAVEVVSVAAAGWGMEEVMGEVVAPAVPLQAALVGSTVLVVVELAQEEVVKGLVEEVGGRWRRRWRWRR